ncbi:MAG: ATP-binding protein [Myxococcales bacterium]
MTEAAESRNAFARRLALIVAVSGFLIAVLGGVALEILRVRSERSSQEALHAVAEQAGRRLGSYIAQQKLLLRALAGALAAEPDANRRLQQLALDAPSLGKVAFVDSRTSPASLRPIKSELLAQALEGTEVSSPLYTSDSLALAMDICVPAPGLPGVAACTTLDLFELQREVQHIRFGETGFALAFDDDGRLFAAGAGPLRRAVVSGEMIVESSFAQKLASGEDPPTRFKSSLGEEVVAGWARLANPAWAIVVEQPTREALRASRLALAGLGAIALLALGAATAVGISQSRKVLTALEIEERWRTAGRIATGITHDLGHRVAVLQATAALADAGDPAYLPLVRDNLREEVATLKKFVADFADLSRNVDTSQFVPLDLNAFADSVRRAAAPFAERAGVQLAVAPSSAPLWVRADRYLLERATLNLLSNAVEASPSGSEVLVHLGQRDAVATLSVRDQGQGIAPDRLPRIFDAFRSTKKTGAHVGMGLPNVRRIVDAHGGKVSVESTPGKGSVFTIELPLAPPG